jgi:hypothetical protein
MIKTFKDCAKCDYVSTCDAHISGGTHKHAEGTDPCQLTDKEDRRKKSIKSKVKRCKCK